MTTRVTQDTEELLVSGPIATNWTQDSYEFLFDLGTVLTSDTYEFLYDADDMEPTPGGRGVQRGEAIGARVEAMDVSVGGRR